MPFPKTIFFTGDDRKRAVFFSAVISQALFALDVQKAAARMAKAFQAALTAIYVRPTDYDGLSDKDKARLQDNIRYAEHNGASITTIVGDDVPAQVAEYAHISGTTKIVVGRSGIRRRHFWSKPPLTEQIILNAPDVDVYIIPDSAADFKQRRESTRTPDPMRPSLRESVYTLLLLAAATVIGLVFTRFGFSESNIITVFILGVLVISVVTINPLYSAVGSLLSVLLFNWFFIDPRSLVLSGHAHGGQVRLFGRGLYAPGQGLLPRYTEGVHFRRLAVSRGLSNTQLVPRLFNPPEIVYLLPGD